VKEAIQLLSVAVGLQGIGGDWIRRPTASLR